MRKIWKKKDFGFGKKNFGSETEIRPWFRFPIPKPNFSLTLIVAKAISGMHACHSNYQPTFIRTLQKNTEATDAKFRAKFIGKLQISRKVDEPTCYLCRLTCVNENLTNDITKIHSIPYLCFIYQLPKIRPRTATGMDGTLHPYVKIWFNSDFDIGAW